MAIAKTTNTRLWWLWALCAALSILATVEGIELTFELPDSAHECFYEIVEKGTKVTVEYQVVTGGNYDVDVTIEDPKKNAIVKQSRTQYDSHTFEAEMTGEYRVCFSNEFSTFTHKVVYLDFQVGEDERPPGVADHLTAMTQLETSAEDIRQSLNSIIDYQTHHRLREAQGRKRAEDLNERVMIWSAFVTAAIFLVSFGQTWVLKSFFSEKKPSQMFGRH